MGSEEILNDLQDIAGEEEEVEKDPIQLLEDRVIQTELDIKRVLLYIKVLASELKVMDANMKILIEDDK